jgi:hypothetical protein
MHCQPCAIANTTTDAVCLCPSCKAALCLDHRIACEQHPGPGGTSYGCGHPESLAASIRRRRPRRRFLLAAA